MHKLDVADAADAYCKGSFMSGSHSRQAHSLWSMNVQQSAEPLPKSKRCFSAIFQPVHTLQAGISPNQSQSIRLAWSDQWELHRPGSLNIVNPEASPA